MSKAVREKVGGFFLPAFRFCDLSPIDDYVKQAKPAFPSKTVEDQREAWVKLTRANLPPIKFSPLLEHFDFDPDRVLKADRRELEAFALSPNQIDRIAAERRADHSKAMTGLDRKDIRIVTLRDRKHYPVRLRTIVDPPPVLFVRGEIAADDQFGFAIVGSRRATAYGLSLARQFGRELAAGGLCIMSGGARGIDTEAHLGALDGRGRTIAVCGCGLTQNYPIENGPLFERIVSDGRGALISEYPPGSTAEPWHFPARNRIISGLSMGVLVIESPVESGALITAHEALDQGRDVMAVPGPIDTGLSSGCHRLIQEGAKLVQTADDIFEELGVLKLRFDEPKLLSKEASVLSPVTNPNLTPIQQQIVGMLSLTPKNLDELSDGLGIPANEISSALTILELNRVARKIAGQGFVRVL